MPHHLSDYLRWGLGGLLVLSGLLSAYLLPGPNEVYLIVFLALLPVLLRRFEAWLVVLPAIIPTIDLGLWSGRLFYNEMDALVLLILGCFLLTQRRLTGNGPSWPPMAYSVFLVAAAISSAIALSSLPEFTSHTPYDYLSPYNAIRVMRPMIWAFLLWWPFAVLWSSQPERCASLFLAGVALGLLGFGVIVLWERGVLLALFGGYSIYGILEAILDTTTTYRVTGVFAEMHTGGTAVDAYLSLAVPLACAGTLVQREWWLRFFCFAALAIGLYAAMATFSRGLYLALGLSIAYYLFVFIGKIQEQIGLKNRTKVIILLSMAAFAFVAYFSFVRAGYTALSYSLFFFFAIIGLRYVAVGRFEKAYYAGAAGLGLLAFLLLQAAFVDSRYNPLSSSQATFVAALFTLLILATAIPMAIAVRPIFRAVYVFPAMALFAVICVVTVPSLAGFRMGERFSTSQNDLMGRFEHWSIAYSFLGSSPLSHLFGIGPGAYPRHYFWSDRRQEDRISYVFMEEGGRSFLRYGGGDFHMMQKVPVQPNTLYRVEVMVRPLSPNGAVGVAVCPKLVLFFHRYQPECNRGGARFEQEGEWQRIAFEIDSGKVGADWPLRLPPTLLVYSRGLVDVTDVRLLNGWDNLVQNGDFAAAGDHWLMASDYNHLAWHAKNLILHFFVEHGILGLAAFVAAMGLAVARLSRAKASQALLAHGLIAALISFLLVGLFGTLVDNTRPALLFYMTLLWALSFRRTEARRASTSRASSKGASTAS